MIILTCANNDKAKDYRKKNQEYRNFSFREVIEATARQAELCGYPCAIFDLGTLGIGEPFTVQDPDFAEKGYYAKEIVEGYKSKSLFKPELVQLVMKRFNDTVIYLDGDAQLVGCLDETAGDDYDIGVTLRPQWETESEWHKQHFEIVKYINAGVIFFNPTEAAHRFVEKWASRTAEVNNDQMALNSLSCPENYPVPYSVELIDGVRIKYFPCEVYNFYFFGNQYPQTAKILHFKGDVRAYYPFNKSNQLFCLMMVIYAKCRTLISYAQKIHFSQLWK